MLHSDYELNMELTTHTMFQKIFLKLAIIELVLWVLNCLIACLNCKLRLFFCIKLPMSKCSLDPYP